MSSGSERGAGAPSGGRDRPVKEYFCLADGRTAALVNSAGACDFWCWPHFDSPLRLDALLDPGRGGSVGVTSALDSPTSVSWVGNSRVILFSFPRGLRIQCCLLSDGAGDSALVWLVDGRLGELVHISLPDPRRSPGWAPTSFGALLERPNRRDEVGGPLALTVSSSTEPRREGLLAELPAEGLVVWLGVPPDGHGLPPRLRLFSTSPGDAVATSRALLESVVASDRDWLQQLHRTPELSRLVAEGPVSVVEAVDRSLLTLRGLQDEGSGLLVASPTTSIPQWPGSERAWDYRYAWLRDCADAGIALSHAGAFTEAVAVARGLGRGLGGRPELAAPVNRLSGGDLPPEHLLRHLRGYSGARVRVGNGAAGQVQLDTLGEVARLAVELDRGGHCPDELLVEVPALADAARRRWRLPDHGIWEVRGEPQDYVHSKVMAWSALQSAVALADGGRIRGDVAGWRAEADVIRREVIRRGRGPAGELVISFQEKGADSALLAAYLVSFLRPERTDAGATLRRVSRDLGRGPLMARHSPERDGLDVPCFPFIFPGLWAVAAEAMLGLRVAAQARLLAICSLTGPSCQLSEVADPSSGALWGNYPQVQSQAALVDAALAIWPPPPSPAPQGGG